MYDFQFLHHFCLFFPLVTQFHGPCHFLVFSFWKSWFLSVFFVIPNSPILLIHWNSLFLKNALFIFLYPITVQIWTLSNKRTQFALLRFILCLLNLEYGSEIVWSLWAFSPVPSSSVETFNSPEATHLITFSFTSTLTLPFALSK